MALKPKVVGIFICPVARGPMIEIPRCVLALKGKGLRGDRYASLAGGSFNKDKPGNRQVTLINEAAFGGTPYFWEESRRNIIVRGVDLNRLTGHEFSIGKVRFKAVKYCFPCDIPSDMAHKPSFRLALEERGGIIAEVLNTGWVHVDGILVPHWN